MNCNRATIQLGTIFLLLLLAMPLARASRNGTVVGKSASATVSPETIAKGKGLCDQADALLKDNKRLEALTVFRQVRAMLPASTRALNGVREVRRLLTLPTDEERNWLDQAAKQENLGLEGMGKMRQIVLDANADKARTLGDIQLANANVDKAQQLSSDPQARASTDYSSMGAPDVDAFMPREGDIQGMLAEQHREQAADVEKLNIRLAEKREDCLLEYRYVQRCTYRAALLRMRVVKSMRQRYLLEEPGKLLGIAKQHQSEAKGAFVFPNLDHLLATLKSETQRSCDGLADASMSDESANALDQLIALYDQPVPEGIAPKPSETEDLTAIKQLESSVMSSLSSEDISTYDKASRILLSVRSNPRSARLGVVSHALTRPMLAGKELSADLSTVRGQLRNTSDRPVAYIKLACWCRPNFEGDWITIRDLMPGTAVEFAIPIGVNPTSRYGLVAYYEQDGSVCADTLVPLPVRRGQ